MHRQARILGVNLHSPHAPPLQHGHLGHAGDGDLIGAVRAMHQPCLLAAQHPQRLGHRPDQIGREGPGQLPFHPRRIGQRPKDVENRLAAKFHPHRHHMLHRRVVNLRHHEADIRLGQTPLGRRRPCHHVDPKLALHIRRARFRTGRAVAMLGHRHASPRHHEGGRRRDIERVHPVAAGADDVHRPFGRAHRDAFRAHRGGGGGIFRNAFAARPHRHQQPRDLRRACPTLEQDLERGFRLCPAQRPLGRRIDQRLHRIARRAHAGTVRRTPASVRKLRSIWWPCCEAMDSGWNCTP